MDRILQDLRGVWRGMRGRPGFATAVILSLGLGLGATGAVTALVDAILVRPLPYPGVDRVLGTWFVSPNFPGGLDRVRQSTATFVHIRSNGRVFEGVGLADAAVVTVREGADVRRSPAAWMTADMFQVLGVSTVIGRPLSSTDSEPGAEPTVVLSDGLWERRYGRSPEAVGALLDVDGVQRRVVGVLPPSVRFPEGDTEMWVPLEIDPTALEGSDFIHTGYLRLKPGVTRQAAEEDLLRLIDLLPESYPNTFPRRLLERLQLSVLLVPLQDELVGDVRQPLLLVLLSVGLLLAIVAANVTALFVVRNESLMKDFAVRAAAGASLSRLQGTMVVEGVLYGGVGAVLGSSVTVVALALVKRLGPDVIPRLHELEVGGRSLALMIALALAMGLGVAALAAVRLRGLDLGATLRTGGKALGAGRGVSHLRKALVSVQVGLALVLLVDTGLLVRTLGALQAVQPGFATDDRLGFRIYLSERDYPTFADAGRFHRRILDGLRGLPGVEGAAAASFLPLRDGRIFLPVEAEGVASTTDLPAPRLFKTVSEGFFEALDVPIVEGRALSRDDADTDQDVVVVSNAFARAYFPDQSAVGRRIRTGAQGRWLEIVGVVADIHDRDLTSPAPPIVFTPLQEQHTTSRWREMSFVLHAADPDRLTGLVGQLVHAVDGGVPVYDVRSMARVLSDVTGRARVTMLLLLASALSALFMAAVGIYGVLAQSVGDRRRELGLRMALGATAAQVRHLVYRQTAALLATGTLLGLVVSVASSRVVQGLVFGVPTSDPGTFVAVAALMALVAWLASTGPARRATLVSPAATLKEE